MSIALMMQNAGYPADKTKTVYGNCGGQDALWLWRQAHELMNIINQKGPFLYSFCGLGKTVGLGTWCTNSNSMYATFAHGLNLKVHTFEGYLAPGIQNTLLPKEELANIVLNSRTVQP